MRGDEPTHTHAVTFLPTVIGPYRFARRLTGEKAMVVDIYKEIPGDPVPRPPEGWDDLGIGGAEVQGRWAWGKEKKSTIENGIAERSRVFDRNKSWSYSFGIILKGVMLVVVSWAVVSIATCLALAFPLVAGRTMYSLLRIPDQYVHDPFAFAIGICLWKPAFSLLSVLWSGDQSIPRTGSPMGIVVCVSSNSKRFCGSHGLDPVVRGYSLGSGLVLRLASSQGTKFLFRSGPCC